MIKNMLRLSALAFVLASSFILTFPFNSATCEEAPRYRFIDLGLQESDQSEAVAINDNGQVAGMYWMLGKKYYFLWNENEGITLIDLPDTANITVLNNAGQLAGSHKDSAGQDRGFIWNSQHGFSDIGTLGGRFTHVYDMNDLGQIVGESESANISLVNGAEECHAFMWQDGFMIDLGALVGDLGVLGDRSIATSINNSGQIIGTSNSLIAHKRKFLRTNNRSVFWKNGIIECVVEGIDYNKEPQYGAWAFSVNNNGLATYENNKVGYFVVDLSTGNKSEIPYSKNFSRDPVISDNGDIFYSMKNYSGESKKIAADIVFFKDKSVGNFSANLDSYEYVYLPNSFVTPNGWKSNSFSGANDFNNNRWVVGSASNIYGEWHAVLLVPLAK